MAKAEEVGFSDRKVLTIAETKPKGNKSFQSYFHYKAGTGKLGNRKAMVGEHWTVLVQLFV